jgi:hypothetical protein
MSTEADNQRSSNELKAKGFEPGTPVYQNLQVRFTVTDLKERLGSPYDAPRPIYVNPDDELLGAMPVVITSMTAVYPLLEGDPLCCQQYPDWKLEGWVINSGFNPHQGLMRVRMYVFGGDRSNPEALDDLMIQRIPDQPDPDGLVCDGVVGGGFASIEPTSN